jgi:hypothetical protein
MVSVPSLCPIHFLPSHFALTLHTHHIYNIHFALCHFWEVALVRLTVHALPMSLIVQIQINLMKSFVLKDIPLECCNTNLIWVGILSLFWISLSGKSTDTDKPNDVVVWVCVCVFESLLTYSVGNSKTHRHYNKQQYCFWQKNMHALSQGYSTLNLRGPEPAGFLFYLIINCTHRVSRVLIGPWLEKMQWN